jgi:tetratricopeptide (TPR) repeat protein/uncharacterized protein YjbI with pentapeptide repeats
MKLDKLTNQAEQMNTMLAEYGSNKMEEILDEVSHELTRIFEYQIAVVKDLTEAAKLGKYAAEKIYASAEGSSFESKHAVFDRDSLINMLIKYEKEFFLEKIMSKVSGGNTIQTMIPVKRSRGDKFIVWKCTEVFTNVGLRVELAGGHYEYRVQPKFPKEARISIPTCGFRSYIFQWNDEIRTFDLSDADQGFTILLSPEEVFNSPVLINYSPYHRLVNQIQLDEFLSQCSASIKPKNFLHFIREQCNLLQDIRPVLRNIRFPEDSELAFADFSNTDMTRLSFSGIRSTQCIYNDARVASAHISNSVMKNSWFMSADMRGSVFTNVDLQGDNSLTKANFRNAIFDEETNLTDNYSFGQAITEHALVLTKKVLFTATTKIQNLESMMSKLVEAKDKKEAELTEKLMQIELEMERVKSQKQRQVNRNPDLPYFYNVRDAVDDFSGRTDSLASLAKYFNTEHEQSYAVAVVTAEGGIGKTQLILEYIFQNKEVYGPENSERVYWITAESVESLSASFKYFAECLNINTENRTEKAILKEIHKKLNTKLEQTLFIFDNVDNMKLIREYLPQATTKHHVIITTRIPSDQWSADYFVLALKPFTMQETRDYIISQVEDASEEDINKISQLFKNVPLALSQAIAFTKEYGLSFHDYLLCYDRIDSFSTQEDRSLYVTTIISLEELEGKYSSAIDIMKIAGFLFADGIPMQIFQPLFSSEEELSKMILLLESSSLIKRKIDPSDGSWRLYIHRLVQDVMREKVRQSNQYEQILIKASQLIRSCMVPHISFDVKDTLSKNGTMLPFALSVISHYEAEASNPNYASTASIMELYTGSVRYYLASSHVTEAAELMSKCDVYCEKFLTNPKDGIRVNAKYWLATVHSVQNHYDKALSIYQACDDVYQEIYGRNHESVVDCLVSIATIYASKGNLEKAMEIYKQTMTIYEELYGHHHAAIADCLSNQAHIHAKLGAHDKAFELYYEALAMREKLYGRAHASVASSLNAIANLLSEKESLDKAMDLYQEALEIFRQVHGNTTASVATALCNIGNMHYRRASYEEATAHHTEALRIYELIYGHEHSATADCIACIASTYYSRGIYDKAMEMYTDILHIYKDIYGHNHADVATALNSLGNIHNRRGELDQALQVFQQALAIRQVLYGENHADVADSLNNLAIVNSARGAFDEAMELYQKAIKIYEVIYGHQHSSIAAITGNMASIHAKRASFEKALELYRESLMIYEAVFGHDHSNVCECLNNIGDIYLKQGNNDKAIVIFTESLAKLEKIYGHNHEAVANTLVSIGEVHQRHREIDQAIALYLDAMNIRMKIYSRNHTSVAAALTKLANIYLEQYKYEESMKANQEALQIFEAVYGHNHATVATCYCNIANVYYSQKDLDKATEAYSESIKVYEAVYGHNHFDVATATSNLANIYCDQEQWDKAIAMYIDAMKINEAIFGHYHGNVAIILDNIGSLYRDQGDHAEAIDTYNKELEICLSIYGKNNIDTIDCLIALGNQCYRASRYEEALQHYEEASPAIDEVYGREHQKSTNVLNMIKDIRENHVRRGYRTGASGGGTAGGGAARGGEGDGVVQANNQACCVLM